MPYLYELQNYPWYVLLIIVVVVFLLIRELVTWYYKLNKITRSLDRQEELLKEISESLKKER